MVVRGCFKATTPSWQEWCQENCNSFGNKAKLNTHIFLQLWGWNTDIKRLVRFLTMNMKVTMTVLWFSTETWTGISKKTDHGHKWPQSLQGTIQQRTANDIHHVQINVKCFLSRFKVVYISLEFSHGCALVKACNRYAQPQKWSLISSILAKSTISFCSWTIYMKIR